MIKVEPEDEDSSFVPQDDPVEEASLACKKCDKTFANPQNLQRHELTHTEEKPYSCPTCNKSFKLKEYLTQHQQVHAAIKPFECDVCHKTFARKPT